MRIRSRLFSFIIAGIFGSLIFSLIDLNINHNIIFFCIILSIIVTFASPFLYDLLLLDSQSTSFLFAGKVALIHHYNPIGQDGKYYNPEQYSITAIYKTYPNGRLRMPQEHTSGFMFSTYHKYQKSNKVEFYEYDTKENGIKIYKFSFSNASSTDYVKEKKINKIPKNAVFVKLNPI